MSLTEKAKLISVYVQEWMAIHRVREARPADVLPYLIEKGVYRADGRTPNPLHGDLRRLKAKRMLSLIRGIETMEKPRSICWYFRRIQ